MTTLRDYPKHLKLIVPYGADLCDLDDGRLEVVIWGRSYESTILARFIFVDTERPPESMLKSWSSECQIGTETTRLWFYDGGSREDQDLDRYFGRFGRFSKWLSDCRTQIDEIIDSVSENPPAVS